MLLQGSLVAAARFCRLLCSPSSSEASASTASAESAPSVRMVHFSNVTKPYRVEVLNALGLPIPSCPLFTIEPTKTSIQIPFSADTYLGFKISSIHGRVILRNFWPHELTVDLLPPTPLEFKEARSIPGATITKTIFNATVQGVLIWGENEHRIRVTEPFSMAALAHKIVLLPSATHALVVKYNDSKPLQIIDVRSTPEKGHIIISKPIFALPTPAKQEHKALPAAPATAPAASLVRVFK